MVSEIQEQERYPLEPAGCSMRSLGDSATLDCKCLNKVIDYLFGNFRQNSLALLEMR